MSEDKQQETPLGYVRIDYEGPPKSGRQVRELQEAVMRVLDRFGAPATSKKNEALQQKTVEGGVIELQLRIPVALLEQASDPIAQQLQAAEQRHYGAAVRAALNTVFLQWRRSSAKSRRR